jgi:alpha-L-fucosidase 2
MKRLLVLVFVAAALPGASLRKNIVFAEAGGVSLQMDASIPEGKGPFPTVILVHGGGWQQGDRWSTFKRIFDPLTNAGFAWFTVDYRLAPRFHYPAAIDDVVLAIEYIEAHAGEYKVDPKRIAISGESAGGHIVAYIGGRYASELHIRAVVPFYPATDFLAMAEGPDKNDRAFRGVMNFVGFPEVDDAARKVLRDASPVAHVHKGMPPFLIVHGTKDELVNPHQTKEFAQLMQAAGNSCEIYWVEGAPHWVEHWEGHPEWLGYKQKVPEWLKQTMP